MFHSSEAYRAAREGYQFLPFRFARLPKPEGAVLLTTDLGEYAILAPEYFRAFVERSLDPQGEVYRDLRARGFLQEPGRVLHVGLKAAAYRTRKSFLFEGPALHIFVVTLRCDHSCPYCQVSRANADAAAFDMSMRSAEAAIDRLFESPCRALTVEFQGGEPALAMGRIRDIVQRIEERNTAEGRSIQFTIVSTLHHFTDDDLAFLHDHRFHVSTSLDGPATLHDRNRPNPTKDSWERTVAGIERVRASLGYDGVAALTTITRACLDHPEEIVDAYVDLGFRSIFLRPLSPYGFALKTEKATGYPMEAFVAFYDRALDYILKLNSSGVEIEEVYTSILLQHILTPFASGYVDLRSPAGAGLGAIVYNYDGRVYASDEGRMAAEVGDHRFLLGEVRERYQQLMQSEAMQWLLASGVAEALPGCADCAFLPYCGSDPIYHATRQGDPIGHRPTSGFCRKHTGLFQIIFRHLAAREPETIRTFMAWLARRNRCEVASAGYTP